MVDTKITGLTADTSPAVEDLIVTVDDVIGSPVNKKVTIADLDTTLSATTKTLTNKTLTSPVINTPTGIVTSDVTASTDKNYVTDAEAVVIGNTSGTNSGDQTLSDLGITADAAEINVLDGATAGTAVASKGLVVDANKDISLGTGDFTATDITASNSFISDEISAQTADTPIKINNGTHQVPATYTPAGAGTATLDVSNTNIHSITMPAGNITIAISNETAGQCFLVEITQDGVGSRTVTWFTTIKWAGGSAPTLTTTASKKDTFVFRVTGTDTYDGYVAGQNI